MVAESSILNLEQIVVYVKAELYRRKSKVVEKVVPLIAESTENGNKSKWSNDSGKISKSRRDFASSAKSLVIFRTSAGTEVMNIKKDEVVEETVDLAVY